jgi:hypothetical protein
MENPMRIAVFCGSSHGADGCYASETKTFARALAQRGMELVYGGGRVGLMGTLADAALEAGVCVTGVMPRSLVDCELAHQNLDELIVVEDMHARKALMARRADAFVALPGGPGTLEEICEVWTWAQLGLHGKPCGFFNIGRYFDELFSFFGRMEKCGFMRKAYLDMLVVSADAGALLDGIGAYKPPERKWL